MCARRVCTVLHVAEVTPEIDAQLQEPLAFFYMQGFDASKDAGQRIIDLPPPIAPAPDAAAPDATAPDETAPDATAPDVTAGGARAKQPTQGARI